MGGQDDDDSQTDDERGEREELDADQPLGGLGGGPLELAATSEHLQYQQQHLLQLHAQQQQLLQLQQQQLLLQHGMAAAHKQQLQLQQLGGMLPSPMDVDAAVAAVVGLAAAAGLAEQQ